MSQLSYVLVAFSNLGVQLGSIADNVSPLDPGQARVTVSHVAFGVGNVDVGTGTELTSLANNLDYANVSAPTLGTAGTGFVNVRNAGSSSPPDISKSVTFESLKSYLVLIVGRNDAAGPLPNIAVYELTDYSIETRLAFVHAVPAEFVVNVVADSLFYLFRNIR